MRSLIILFIYAILLDRTCCVENPSGSSGPRDRSGRGWQQKNNNNQPVQTQPSSRPQRLGARGPHDFANQNAKDDARGRWNQQQELTGANQQQQGSGRDQRVYIEEGTSDPVKDMFPGDRVPLYTKKVHHRAAVALVAFMSATMLSLATVKLVLSKTSIFLSLVFATGCFFSCYTKGDFAQFSNALGVGTILFVRKLKPRQFTTRAFGQLLAAVMLSDRRPFPPVENPWRCKDVLDSSEVPYSMINVLISMVFTGMILGFNVGNMIPFFPAWIGGLISSAFFAYVSTTRNPKGDLLRFIGHSINIVVSDLFACAEDVYLQEKTGIFLNHTFGFVHRVDQKLGLIGKVQAVLGKAADFAYKAKVEMVDSNQ